MTKQPTTTKNTALSKQLAKWEVEKHTSIYIKEKLGEESKSGKTHIDDIVDNAIDKAKVEEEPKWTPLILGMAEPNKGNGTNVNVQVNNITEGKQQLEESMKEVLELKNEN